MMFEVAGITQGARSWVGWADGQFYGPRAGDAVYRATQAAPVELPEWTVAPSLTDPLGAYAVALTMFDDVTDVIGDEPDISDGGEGGIDPSEVIVGEDLPDSVGGKAAVRVRPYLREGRPVDGYERVYNETGDYRLAEFDADDARKIFDGFKHGDLHVEVSDAASAAYDTNVTVSGRIFQGSRDIGSFERLFNKRRRLVHHSSLRIESPYQGAGFASAFNRHAEQEYVKHGFQQVALSAVGAGTYAWARAGFRFNGNTTEQIADIVDSALGANISPGDRPVANNFAGFLQEFLPINDAEAADEELRAKLPYDFVHMGEMRGTPAALRKAGKALTEFEIADIGRQYTWDEAGRKMWPGKWLLLRGSWSGIKDLVPSEEQKQIVLHDVARVYDEWCRQKEQEPPDADPGLADDDNLFFGDDDGYWQMIDEARAATKAAVQVRPYVREGRPVSGYTREGSFTVDGFTFAPLPSVDEYEQMISRLGPQDTAMPFGTIVSRGGGVWRVLGDGEEPRFTRDLDDAVKQTRKAEARARKRLGDELSQRSYERKVDKQAADKVAAFYHGFRHGPYEARITKAENFGGAIHVSGVVLDHASGTVAGTITRTLDKLGDSVDHDELMLRPNVQGQGFAGALMLHSDNEYRKAGIKHVHVFTAQVGGYAWARAGFTFEGTEHDGDLGDTPADVTLASRAISGTAHTLRRALGQFTDREKSDAWAALQRSSRPLPRRIPKDLLNEFVDRTISYDEMNRIGAYGGRDAEPFEQVVGKDRAVKMFRSESEIAGFGRDRYTWEQDGQTMWLGKWAMLGSAWRGVRDVPAETKAADSEQAVAAAHDRWLARMVEQGGEHFPDGDGTDANQHFVDDAALWDEIAGRAAKATSHVRPYLREGHPVSGYERETVDAPHVSAKGWIMRPEEGEQSYRHHAVLLYQALHAMTHKQRQKFADEREGRMAPTLHQDDLDDALQAVRGEKPVALVQHGQPKRRDVAVALLRELGVTKNPDGTQIRKSEAIQHLDAQPGIIAVDDPEMGSMIVSRSPEAAKMMDQAVYNETRNAWRHVMIGVALGYSDGDIARFVSRDEVPMDFEIGQQPRVGRSRTEKDAALRAYEEHMVEGGVKAVAHVRPYLRHGHLVQGYERHYTPERVLARLEEIRDAKPPEIRNPYERERVIAMQNAITRATQNDSIDALAEHLSSQIEQRREQQHAVGYTGPEVPLDWQIFVHLRRGHMLKGYSKRIDATPDEYERLVAEHLRGLTRDAQVKIRTREEIIPDIVKTGRFKNQIQTRRKSPPAHYNPDDRKRLEQEMFGMPEAAKAKDYGIYAYLSSRQEPYYTTVNAYGPVRWVLKPHVRARTSITFGDMLDNYDHEWVIPSAVDAVDWYAYGRGLNSARIDPFTESSVDSNVRNNQARYVDALVHGGVSLDDVEAVEWDDGRAMLDHPAEEVQWAYDFLATNPSEDRADAARNRVALYEAAKALADHGIEVRAVPQAGPIPQPLKPDETVAALRGGQ